MEPLEGLEDFLTVGVVEADPIVSDVVGRDTTPVLGDAQLDPSVIARSRVLPCILKQVGQENPQKRLVSSGLDFRLRLELHVAIRDQRPQIVDDLSPQRRQVDFRSAEGRLPAPSDLLDFLEDDIVYERRGGGYVVLAEGDEVHLEFDGNVPLAEWVALGGSDAGPETTR